MVVLQLREEREREGGGFARSEGKEEEGKEGEERRRKGKRRKENQSRSSVLTCFSRR